MLSADIVTGRLKRALRALAPDPEAAASFAEGGVRGIANTLRLLAAEDAVAASVAAGTAATDAGRLTMAMIRLMEAPYKEAVDAVEPATRRERLLGRQSARIEGWD